MQSLLNVSTEWIEGVVGTPLRMYSMYFLLVSGLGMLVYATQTSGWHSALILMLLLSLLQLSLLLALRRLYVRIEKGEGVVDHVV
jgi:hypothetical protein